MNNVDKAMELANEYAADSSWKTSSAIRTHLEAMEADRVRLLEALKASRETLQRTNDSPREIITDTIWHTSYETLFDFIDSAIAQSEAQS